MTQETKIINGVIFEKDEPRPWKRMILLVGGAAVFLSLVVGLFIWKPWHNEPPRLNDAPTKIAAFTISSDFKKLPFDRQIVYLKKVDDSEKELVEAYRAGQLSQEDLSKALQAAYFGRHIRRMENFHERRTQKERDAYLDKLLDKKHAEKEGIAWQKKDGTKVILSPDAKDADDVKHIERDVVLEAEVLQTWPAEIQQRWKEYHAAVDERKKFRKEKERQAEEAAKGTVNASGNTPAPPR